MFQPAIPLGGLGGWTFLKSTYSRQLESFAEAPAIRNDRTYLNEALAEPVSVETFLDDRRLLRVTLTAFDLAGEEWKRGFIDKVLSEAADPESTFLQRLNNDGYTRFAEAFTPQGGEISVSAAALADIANQYEAAAFRLAVGEVDNSMRLSLNYQSQIVDIVGSGTNEQAILYRILGNVPVRTVMETALNLPADMRSLPLERQADMLQDRLGRTLGIRDVSQLTSLDAIDRVLERFHVMESLNAGPSASAPGAPALALLNGSFGMGSGASENLFLSLLR